jgi:HEAT repeat protein
MRDVSTAPILMDVLKPPRSFKKQRHRTNAVKTAALWALGEIGDYSAIPYCREILQKRSWLPFLGKGKDDLRAAAALALGRIDSDECREILQQYRDDRSDAVRRAAIEALRGIQRRRVVATVEEKQA